MVDLTNPSRTFGSYFVNLISIGIMGTVQQFCDLYLTYTRFRTVNPKFSNWKASWLGMFLFVATFVSWVPFYTILPFWVDCNTAQVLHYQNLLYNYVCIPGIVVFDVLFTGYFIVVLYRLPSNVNNVADRAKLSIVGAKSILHCLLRLFSINIVIYEDLICH